MTTRFSILGSLLLLTACDFDKDIDDRNGSDSSGQAAEASTSGYDEPVSTSNGSSSNSSTTGADPTGQGTTGVDTTGVYTSTTGADPTGLDTSTTGADPTGLDTSTTGADPGTSTGTTGGDSTSYGDTGTSGTISGGDSTGTGTSSGGDSTSTGTSSGGDSTSYGDTGTSSTGTTDPESTTTTGSGGDTGTTGGDPGSIACDADPQAFPAFDKQCVSKADCAVVAHTVDCCGNERLIGINAGAVGAFAEAEAVCDGQLPQCNCVANPPIAEDGNSVLDADEVSLACKQNQCETFLY